MMKNEKGIQLEELLIACSICIIDAIRLFNGNVFGLIGRSGKIILPGLIGGTGGVSGVVAVE